MTNPESWGVSHNNNNKKAGFISCPVSPMEIKIAAISLSSAQILSIYTHNYASVSISWRKMPTQSSASPNSQIWPDKLR
jgi:hypothetical protein